MPDQAAVLPQVEGGGLPQPVAAAGGALPQPVAAAGGALWGYGLRPRSATTVVVKAGAGAGVAGAGAGVAGAGAGAESTAVRLP